MLVYAKSWSKIPFTIPSFPAFPTPKGITIKNIPYLFQFLISISNYDCIGNAEEKYGKSNIISTKRN